MFSAAKRRPYVSPSAAPPWATDPRLPMLNAFTIDVEDYFQVSAFEDRIDRAAWKTYPSRVVGNTLRLLDLLDRRSTRATFFVLGWTAVEYPELMATIRDRGHELGSHSFWHRLVYRQTPAEFRIDLRDSLRAIEDASGVAVTCYRAPSFSITKKSQWALDVLAEEGIRIDSSIYPIHHDRYGMPDSEPWIHHRVTSAGPLLEFPPAVLKTRVGNVPVSGGGYFRLYPKRFTASCIRRVNRAGQPFMFYVHPWEVDPAQPKLPSSSRVKTWRHRVNLKSTYAKLDALLTRFSFGTMSDSISHARDNSARLTATPPACALENPASK
jgi:polysaccharide deacetylase family protein (PEP-CTERM system associated)